MKQPPITKRSSPGVLFAALLAVGLLPSGCKSTPQKPPLPTQAVAPEPSCEVYDTFYRAHNSVAYVYLKNASARPIEVAEIRCQGHLVPRQPEVRAKSATAHWARVWPNPIPPGGLATVDLCLTNKAADSVDVRLCLEGGEDVHAVVPAVESPLQFTDVTMEPNLAGINAYLAAPDVDPGAVQRVWLDGRDVTENVEPYFSGFHRGAAGLAIRLAQPLRRGSFHVLRVDCEHAHATAQFRVIIPFFPLGTYGNYYFRDYSAHGLNHYLSFRSVGSDGLAAALNYGITVGGVYVRGGGFDRKTKQWQPVDEEATGRLLDSVRQNPALLYLSHSDEPDVADYHLGKQIGAGAGGTLARDLWYRENCPELPTFVQIDNTFRPLNYHVYAPLADIPSTHRYAIGGNLVQQAGAALTELRLCGRPRPFYWVTQFFRLVENRKRTGRFPDPEEMRVQIWQAAALGAKGVIHYIHSGSGGKGEGPRNPELWQAMTGIHEQLRAVAPALVRGTPVKWAETDCEKVKAHCILCPGPTLVIILINYDFDSARDAFRLTEHGPVAVSVSLPEGVDFNTGELILDGGGAQRFGCQVKDGILKLDVEKVKTVQPIRVYERKR